MPASWIKQFTRMKHGFGRDAALRNFRRESPDLDGAGQRFKLSRIDNSFQISRMMGKPFIV